MNVKLGEKKDIILKNKDLSKAISFGVLNDFEMA